MEPEMGWRWPKLRSHCLQLAQMAWTFAYWKDWLINVQNECSVTVHVRRENGCYLSWSLWEWLKTSLLRYVDSQLDVKLLLAKNNVWYKLPGGLLNQPLCYLVVLPHFVAGELPDPWKGPCEKDWKADFFAQQCHPWPKRNPLACQLLRVYHWWYIGDAQRGFLWLCATSWLWYDRAWGEMPEWWRLHVES